MARRRHTFITGGTGSGKSETIKYLIRQGLLQNTQSAMIVLDPHGALVNAISRLPQLLNSDRLVFISPTLSNNHRVTINPFECSDTSESGIEVQSAHLVAAFEQILGGFTLNMNSLLAPVISVLLHRENSDFSDLVRFLSSEHNKDLVKYGQRQMPYDEHRRFFTEQFHSRHYDGTKEALRNRFQSFLNVPTIKRFTCGHSTLSLESQIDNQKIILFDLSVSSTSKNATVILGQLITALIQGYSIRRQRYQGNAKTPIHLFADECQYFISHSTEIILGEARKFGLYLTLATQRTQQVGDQILDAVLGNVGVFLTGKSRGKTLKKMASELDIATEEIKYLRTGQFYLSIQERQAEKIKVPFTGYKGAMTIQQWHRVRDQQLQQYYQPLECKEKQPEKTYPYPDLSLLSSPHPFTDDPNCTLI